MNPCLMITDSLTEMVTTQDAEQLFFATTQVSMFREVFPDPMETLLKLWEVSLQDKATLPRLAELLFFSAEVSLHGVAVSLKAVEVSPKAREKVLEPGEMSLSCRTSVSGCDGVRSVIVLGD